MNKNSISIYRIFQDDQSERKSARQMNPIPKSFWAQLREHDLERLGKLKILIKSPELRGVDYFRASVMFLHGKDLSDLKLAQKLAELGARKGYSRCLRINALATDRILVTQGKLQKFGTQSRIGQNGRWELFPYNPRTTDSERRKYRVHPLHKLKKIVEYLNAK